MLKIILLIIAVCTDGFAASIGIGAAGIKIPFRSELIISFAGTLFLSCSIIFADAIKLFIPKSCCDIISFLLLFLLGIFNICQNSFKKLIKNRKHGSAKAGPAEMFFDGAAADTDHSKSISAGEAVVLSAALSADSLITGIGAGFGKIALPILSAGVFAASMLSLAAGQRLGRKLVSTFKINLGWLCGAVLIVLAFLNL